MPASASARRWLFRSAYLLFLLVVLLIALEIGLRWFGPGPWRPDTQSFHVEPGGRMFQPDSILGYKGMPGEFICTIGGKHRFQLSHDPQGFRPTSTAGYYPNARLDTVAPPEIWILGCSFTHGYGVDDSATWPWQAQRQLPRFKIRNFAMTAYGTLHAALLMDMMQDAPHPPRYVVLAHGAFHEQRNTASRFWRKALHGRQAAADIRYPHAIALDDKASQWRTVLGDLRYDPWPGQQWSALIHQAEIIANHREERQLQSHALTRALIAHIMRRTHAHGADFILLGIQQDEATRQMLQQFQRPVIVHDISQDPHDPAMRLLPDDPHPSPAAHREMADEFVRLIQHESNPLNSIISSKPLNFNVP